MRVEASAVRGSLLGATLLLGLGLPSCFSPSGAGGAATESGSSNETGAPPSVDASTGTSGVETAPTSSSGIEPVTDASTSGTTENVSDSFLATDMSTSSTEDGIGSSSTSTSSSSTLSFASSSSSTGGATEPMCGNGIVEEDEACDDGNEAGSDSCVDCARARCGDGEVWIGEEECDEGPENAASAACREDCRRNVCGDGAIYVGVEECDDGNRESNDGCSSDCFVEENCFEITGVDCLTGNQTYCVDNLATMQEAARAACRRCEGVSCGSQMNLCGGTVDATEGPLRDLGPSRNCNLLFAYSGTAECGNPSGVRTFESGQVGATCPSGGVFSLGTFRQAL